MVESRNRCSQPQYCCNNLASLHLSLSSKIRLLVFAIHRPANKLRTTQYLTEFDQVCEEPKRESFVKPTRN